MSENLIYGADITAYGAASDGKTDCSDAFIKAIENGESLISVPYGKYLIKKALKLTSNIKIHLHSGAEIIFDTRAKCCITASECSSVIICGGRWICEDEGKTLFSFTGSSGIKISDCSISASLGAVFKNCEDISVKNTSFDIDGDCISLRGEVENLSMRNISAFSCVNIIDIDENAKVEDVFAYDINLVECKHLLGVYGGELEESRFCGIYGDISDSLIYVAEQACVNDADFEDIEVYCSVSSKDAAYFDLKGSIDGVEITGFKRNSNSEALPFIPTLILKPENGTTAIIDGLSLDNVIAARGKSKTVAMTTARLTNPTNKFIYTLECGIDEGDTFTLPLGDFDFMTIYKK